MSAVIRVALVEDHAIVLHGLEKLFGHDAGFRVVACCRNGEAGLAACRKIDVDVVVLDLRMPGMSGLDLLRALRAEQLPCRTVVLTATASDADVAAAVRLGAQGVVLKESSPIDLMECVRRVHAGERWLDPQVEARRAGEGAPSRDADANASSVLLSSLTPRERDIVRLLAQGHRNRAIAQRLAISEGTVKIHLHNVYDKLGVDGRLELLLLVRAAV